MSLPVKFMETKRIICCIKRTIFVIWIYYLQEHAIPVSYTHLLSNSRNMAIKHYAGDICLLCDDDERFLSSYEDLILNAFKSLPKAYSIAFNVKGHKPRLRQRIQRIGFLKSLRLASYHLAFRRQSVLNACIHFDPLMGAGSGNGGGEENKFLIECLKKNLRIYYVPAEIAVLCPSASSWFFGYDKIFFKQRGTSTKYMLGMPFAIIYGFYYLLAKHSIYSRDISLWSCLLYTSRCV